MSARDLVPAMRAAGHMPTAWGAPTCPRPESGGGASRDGRDGAGCAPPPGASAESPPPTPSLPCPEQGRPRPGERLRRGRGGSAQPGGGTRAGTRGELPEVSDKVTSPFLACLLSVDVTARLPRLPPARCRLDRALWSVRGERVVNGLAPETPGLPFLDASSSPAPDLAVRWRPSPHCHPCSRLRPVLLSGGGYFHSSPGPGFLLWSNRTLGWGGVPKNL